MLTIRTLGTLELTLDQAPLPLRNRKAQALLVYLAIHAGQLFTRAHLQTLLWSNSDNRRGRTSLRQTLNQLQRALPPNTIHVDGQEIGMGNTAQFSLDLTDVTRNPLQYTGQFLQGVDLPNADSWFDWLLAFRESLNKRVIDQLDAVGREAIEQAEYGAAINCFERILAIDIWREQAHRSLMEAFWRAGDRMAALAQYERCKQMLLDQLGVEPTVETQALAQLITNTVDSPTGNLPTHDLSPLIGRETEIAEISNLLTDHPLVTIVGLGGIGKTRVAIGVGRTLMLRDGVWLVDLSDVAHESNIAPTIAVALGLAFMGTESLASQLINYLQEKQLLLIVDNYEQLLPNTSLLEQILRMCPQVRLLVTSRQSLKLRDEMVVRLKGLSDPAGAELFHHHAKRTQRNFVSDPAGVQHLCRILEGMPLAIQMAAPWVAMMSVGEITREIENDLGLLQTTDHDHPQRHQNYQTIFAHTLNRLTPAERETLNALAIFQHGFDRTAARQVSGASLFTLLALLDKSLLQRIDGSHFRLHARLRQFVLSQLSPSQQDNFRYKHAVYYLQWLSEQRGKSEDGKDSAVLDAIAMALENVQLAWQWGGEQGLVDLLLGAYRALYQFFHVRGRFVTGRELSTTALNTLPPPHTPNAKHLRFELLVGAGNLTHRLGNIDEAVGYMAEARALAQQIDDTSRYAKALTNFSHTLIEVGRVEEATILLDEAVDLYRSGKLIHPANEMHTYNILGILHKIKGNYTEAQQAYGHSLRLAQQQNHQRACAYLYNNLGVVALDGLGDFATAMYHYQQAHTLFVEIDEPRMVGMTANNIGNVHMGQEAWGEALHWFNKGLMAVRDTGEQWVLGLLLYNLGECEILRESYPKAQIYLQQSLAVFSKIGDSTYQSLCWSHLARVARCTEPVNGAKVKQAIQQAIGLAEGVPTKQLAALAEWGGYLVQTQRLEEAVSIFTMILAHPNVDSHSRRRIAMWMPEGIEGCPVTFEEALEQVLQETQAEKMTVT